jgi:large subunit ribosomal protein L6
MFNSRISKTPIKIPAGVSVLIEDSSVIVKGPKGAITKKFILTDVTVAFNAENEIVVTALAKTAKALSGTVSAIVTNLINGVSVGFEKRLELVGVGYRAQMQGTVLNLSLGFSHPVAFEVPTGLVIETPTQTEVVIKGVDKDLVGQIAAKIIKFRPPEPYKGKGIRFVGQVIKLKETKKK